jgi:hypothetical protein
VGLFHANHFQLNFLGINHEENGDCFIIETTGIPAEVGIFGLG